MRDNSTTTYAMDGLIAAWDGRNGYILTGAGEQVYISGLMLRTLGIAHEPEVGDRIHFWAEQRNETFRLNKIRMIASQQTGAFALRRIKTRYLRDLAKELLRPIEYDSVRLTGTLDSFNRKKGFGFIRLEDGELVLLHVTCVRASGYQDIELGSILHFETRRRANRVCVSVRILSVTPP
jgi:cold shock CspA family protein